MSKLKLFVFLAGFFLAANISKAVGIDGFFINAPACSVKVFRKPVPTSTKDTLKTITDNSGYWAREADDLNPDPQSGETLYVQGGWNLLGKKAKTFLIYQQNNTALDLNLNKFTACITNVLDSSHVNAPLKAIYWLNGIAPETTAVDTFNIGWTFYHDVHVPFDTLQAFLPGAQGHIRLEKTRNDTTFFRNMAFAVDRARFDAQLIADTINFGRNNFTVFKDVGVTAIEIPIGTIDSSGLVIPRAKVKNNGNIAQTFNVAFKIGSVYTSNPRTKTLQGGVEDTVNFNSWVPVRGIYTTKCSTYLNGDNNSGNDTMSRSLTVNVKDVGVTAIEIPIGTIVSNGSAVIPRARVKNYGNIEQTFDVKFKIGDIYTSTSGKKTLAGGIEDTVNFNSWVPVNGIYVTKCSTQLGDNNPRNDTMSRSLTVQTEGWHPKDPVPTKVIGPPAKYVKEGGALVAVATSAETALFAFRGNTRSKEFYKYYPIGDSWSSPNAMESIPFGKNPTDTSRINNKTPGKGASLAWNGGDLIYAIKGNSTRELWKYSISGNSWEQKSFLPYPPVKELKGGSSILYYNNKLWLLVGGQKKDSANFFVYDPANDIVRLGTDGWSKVDTAPQGVHHKTWIDGSCLTTLDNTIYALKGGDKQGYFYKYNPLTNIWTQLESIPKVDTMTALPSRILKKTCTPKDGTAIAGGNDLIYAEKGGGSWQLWKYNPNTNHWYQSISIEDTIPRLNSRSYAKTGAGMAFAKGALWLMKGNNTPEFWQYIPSEEMSNVKGQMPKVTQNVIASESEVISSKLSMFNVTPNPFTKLTTIYYTVQVYSKISIKLYDATGKLVVTLINDYINAGNYSLKIENWKLGISKGIYFLRYNNNTMQKEIKLIVE